uniref:General transcription factor IIIC, polypeptide 3 n=1 Tax=Oncorhynchus mykiss TaxID=8022 RepID=A0A8K9XBL5_ONCMY
MSGFSSELIDYLEGRISFEEFEIRREERKEEEEDDDEDNDDDYEEEEEEDSEEERKVEAKGDEEGPSAGDVFALEMELNRENKKMMKERRNRSKLPRALRGLMGEANIRYARGDKEDAVLMCMEIIRQAPLAYEPFSTLAMIYEDQGDMEKSLQFGLIAAHLNPSDCEEWVKLADMSLERDNIRQAIICYTKAIKYDPSNVRYLWERCSLYEQVGEHKQSMDGYRRILNLLPPTDGEHFMQLSRDMAKSYYESSDLPSAMGVMEEALRRHTELVTDESINMAAELYIANHQHDKALQVCVCVCVCVCEKMESEEEVVVPDHVPVDIRVKLMVCLIHQHVYRPLDSMLTSLMEQSPEELGDLYLDVAEAFLDQGEYNSALPLLSALVCSERYNLAVVWLRHAECLKALGHMEVAVKSYNKVVQMAPLHLEARLCLSTLQQQLGRPLCALKALEPMYDPDTLAQDASAAQQELKLLLHRSTLLRSQGRLDDYLDTMLTMLAMLLKVAMTRAQVCVKASMWAGVRHLRLVKVSKDLVSDIHDQEAAYQDISGKTSVLSREDWWLLLVRCVCTLCEMKRFKEAELLLLFSGTFTSYNHALCVLSGHNALVSGSFKHALGQYVQAFRSKPDEPLYSLCVGLTFFHMASQKFVVKRHPLILQGFSFLWRYVEQRGPCQESMYNLGRALQQMGLAHLAIHYYHKALSFPPLTLEGIADDQVDLRREIAFNLSIIYQASGNTEMVRHLINTYCTV